MPTESKNVKQNGQPEVDSIAESKGIHHEVIVAMPLHERVRGEPRENRARQKGLGERRKSFANKDPAERSQVPTRNPQRSVAGQALPGLGYPGGLGGLCRGAAWASCDEISPSPVWVGGPVRAVRAPRRNISIVVPRAITRYGQRV